jgi:hypothetical protein
MKRLFWRLTPALLFGFTVVGTGGCSDPNNDVKPGAPVLQSFSVIDNATGGTLDIADTDAGPAEVTGFVHLTALFDRLLDPTTVTTLDDGGVDQGASVDAVTFTPALPTGQSVSFTSIYTPNGDATFHLFLPAGPNITTTATPTFPSGATITATLDRTKIRSKKGEPFVGDDSIVFHTLAFAAAIAVPMADADPDAGTDAGVPPIKPEMEAVTISFTNLPKTADPMVPGDDDIANHITVTANGAPFTDVTIAGEGNPTVVDVTPTTAWPANATIVITVDATAADAIGSTTGAVTTASFTTSAS